MQRLSALGVALLAGVGCSGITLETVRADVAAGHGHLITSVPFIPQEDYQCGPAALAMVLRYYGAALGQEEIARALYLASARGTLNLELEFYARRRGFEARAFAGTLEQAKDELRRGRPLIVFQDVGAPGYTIPHFAVLLGYDDRAAVVVLHSGPRPYRVVSYDDFGRTWARRRAWTLLVTPRGESAVGRDLTWLPRFGEITD
jgi:ABC-type bacteriocin/lantibiotic exporter with double-glycine peptidase domain